MRTPIPPAPLRPGTMAAGLALALVLALVPAGVHAQGIVGTVVESQTREPVEAVLLTLQDSAGVVVDRAQTDGEGRFALAVEQAGYWVVTAERLGFGTVSSNPIFATPGQEVVLEIALGPDPIELEEPVVVTARWSYASADLREFQERRKRGERTGLGRFVTRPEIERRSPTRPSDLLQAMPGLRVSPSMPGRGRVIQTISGCVPAIYIDGTHINRNRNDRLDDFVSPLAIEGIEVYRGAQYQVDRFYDPFGCGLILVWTRRGEQTDEPFSWQRFGLGAALVGALFLLF